MIYRIKCWLYGHDLDFKKYIDKYETDLNGENTRIVERKCFCNNCKRFIKL